MTRQYFASVRLLIVMELVLRLKGLLLIPLLSKYFGALNYGVWAQVSVIVAILGPALLLGLDSAVLRFLPGRPSDEIASGFSSVFIFLALVSLPAVALIWLLSVPIASAFFGSAANGRFVALSGAMTVVGLLLNQCRSFFRVIGSAKGYAAITLTQAGAGLLIGAGIAVCHGSVWLLVCLMLAADFALLLGASFVIVSRNGVGMPHWGIVSKSLRYGLPLVPGAYAMVALNSSDRLFIAHYGSMGDIGVYSLVYSLGYMLVGLFFGPIWLMYPSNAAEAFNRGDLSALRRLYRSVTSSALGLLVPAAVGMTVLAGPVVRLVAGEEFASAASLFPLITAAYVLHMMSSFYDVNLGLVGRQAWSTVSILIAAVINIGLNFIFVPRFGITGAATTTLIGFGIQFALSAYLGSRYIKLPFDILFMAKSFLASAIMGAVVWFLPGGRSLWMLAFAVGLGTAIYIAALLALKALSIAQLRTIVFGWQSSDLARQVSAQIAGGA